MHRSVSSFAFALIFVLAPGCRDNDGGSAGTGAGGAGGAAGAGGIGGAGGAGGIGGAGGAGGMGGAGGAGGMASCDLSVDPSGTDDVTYDAHEMFGCESATLCEPSQRAFLGRVLACEAVEGGFFFGLGSTYVRVAGRENGNCVIDVATEIEGSAAAAQCSLPLPIEVWPGLLNTGDAAGTGFLEGIGELCPPVGSCSIFDEAPNPCSAASFAISTCVGSWSPAP